MDGSMKATMVALALVLAGCNLEPDCTSICYKLDSYHKDSCPELNVSDCEAACNEQIGCDQPTIDDCYFCTVDDNAACGSFGCRGECKGFFDASGNAVDGEMGVCETDGESDASDEGGGDDGGAR